MSIKIPVSAQFDAADVKKQIQIINDQIKNLSNTVALAQKQKFEPITLKSKEDLTAFINQAQKLLKIQTELNQKLGQSGQGGKNPFLADWSKMYGDKAQRIEKMRSALQFMGVEFDDLPKANPKPKPPVPAPGGGGSGARPPANPPSSPVWQSGWGRQGLNVLHSGLGAAGPVGGVFSNALNSGLSGGAGAGLMGLVGGLAALGVGKLIGAIANKIDHAQDAAIGMDKIYRQIGGIASYGAIKNTTYGVGNALGMDVTEANTLASTYARSAMLRRGDNLESGMMLAGGMARSYGLDPNSVAGIMGGFRGSNIARNDTDSKRIGLVIGETIAKSGAFAKADEVMQAVSQYAIAQARQSLNGPDIARYGAGMSSLLGMNLPGMDVAGSAALLSRVNSALMNGGAGGMASQMLTAGVGNMMGLNPFQLRVMRENGMYGTKSSVFGKNSIYGQTLGAGPEGDQSYFSATRDTLRNRYGNNKEQYYLALATHMGISVSQAMALDKMDTGTVNGAGARLSRLGLNIGSVNERSIATLGQIESGKGLGELSERYLLAKGKDALSDQERNTLTTAYKGNDPEKLKDALASIAAKHGGVETEGSQIRDSIAQLNNTATRIADNALPALNIMRMALVKMAGGTEADLQAHYIKTEQAKRSEIIRAGYADRMAAARKAEQDTYTTGGAFGNQAARAKAGAVVEKLNQSMQAEIDKSNAEVVAQATGKTFSASSAGETDLPEASPSAAAAAAQTGERSVSVPSVGNVGGGGGSSAGERNVTGGNIGNLRDTSGHWRRFGSAREGLAAMATQLLRYRSGAFQNSGVQRKTLRQIISTYAPSKENDTSQYINQVSQWTGIRPDDEIDLRDHDTLAKIMKAMVRKENGDKGLAAAEGHYDEAIGDAMRNSSRWRTQAYDVNLNMTLDTPQGKYKAEHTLKPYKADNQFSGRFYR
ncbi:lytic transglycosylase [Salmonella enterica]|nr:lytic transglycosylase [Salmonella enterica]EBL0923912.1 lytic transglycosylase [Salmonella enterica]